MNEIKFNEININIEGYNVAGICVGCLNYNRKMSYGEDIYECFRLLGNINVPDGLSMQICWECRAAVRNTLSFQAQILNAYKILIDYSQKNTFLNSPQDLNCHAKERLIVVTLDNQDLCQDTEEGIEPLLDIVKKELDLKYDEEPKLEPDQFNNEDFDSQLLDEFPPQDAFLSSEEDVQLSKLKDKKKKLKKEKKGKKKKKNKLTEEKEETDTQETEPKPSRKLKNLPDDLVELYTMAEEEMWQVRSEDVENAAFLSLKYRCSDCIIGFNTQKLMFDHMTGKHNPKGPDCHQCDVCKAYFSSKDIVSVHRALHLTAYRCKECGLKTTMKRLMLRHCRDHDITTGEYICKICNNVFSSKWKLLYHKSVCKQEKPQCDCCGKVFANKTTLKSHLRPSERKDDKSKEKLYIPCKGCDKVFHTRKSYRAHVVIHNGIKYPCPICGKLFQWKRNLSRHTRNHRERETGALHECRECGKTFASRDCYNNHMRLSKKHVGEEAYVHECNYCGKKFPTKWCMVDHIDWDHLKRIKYQCSVCFKPFKTAKIMVAHMNNIHGGKKGKELEGEHLCEICGKSYRTVKRLKGHVWAMHTNRSTTKSFKCQLCPATFTWQTSIYKHVKMMHHSNKRNKPQRTKKPEPYPGIELTNRLPYFQQNVNTNLAQNIVQLTPSTGIVQNI